MYVFLLVLKKNVPNAFQKDDYNYYSIKIDSYITQPNL